MVTALVYLTTSTPDIVHATCYCTRYQAKPIEKYLTAVKQIFRYLKNTINMGLWYPKDIGFKLNAFLDSDHSGCLYSCKSTSGGIQFISGDKLVSWTSKKQDYTSMSLAEAEYVSLSACCAQAFTGFSGQSVYDDWYMLIFNVFLTSMPVISLGVFEQDVSSEICLQFPALYQQGPRNLFFDWYRILGWMGNGLYCSLIVFFLNIIIFYDQAFRSDGQTADMAVVGTSMFTCIIYAVTCQIALTMSHFTWMQHIFIGASIVIWYIILVIYGMLPPSRSGDVHKLFLEALAPAPIYWLSILLVTVACNLPYLAHISFQRSFNPMDHHVIQEIKFYKKDVEDHHMWRREKSKARQETKIGFSARVDAKIRHLRFKLHKKSSLTSPRANGNSKKSLGRDSKGGIIILPPVSFEEHVTVQRETKARTLLLQSLPEDHMADFHHLDDAREIWLAVKARFGGNEESKKMRKTMLKREFSEFRVSEEEGLHKGYDEGIDELVEFCGAGKVVAEEHTLKR
uniref:Probable phospholipid-transporting ATPase 4 n=1 Tax=Tanacetum cinerariifolium TaxID=118510 RepID=A0A6L2MN80_TANCI|nr:probable phospholipid-transporting ATPase 4 [Tanacetum cinerariifolium]